MKRLTQTTLMSAAVLTTISFSALMAQASGAERIDFDAVDTNADGFLSRDELIAERDKKFDLMDADKNGLLSDSELKKDWSDSQEKHGKYGGGGHGEKSFEKVDTDNDGSISPEEYAAASKMRKSGKGGYGGKSGGHGGKYRKKGKERFLRKIDANGDGEIDKSEMTSGIVDWMMAKIDTDKDNRISRKELENAPKMFGKKH